MLEQAQHELVGPEGERGAGYGCSCAADRSYLLDLLATMSRGETEGMKARAEDELACCAAYLLYDLTLQN